MFKDLVPVPGHQNQARWRELVHMMIPRSNSTEFNLEIITTMHNVYDVSPFEVFAFAILLISNRQDIDWTSSADTNGDMCRKLVQKLRLPEARPIFEWLIVEHDATIQAVSEAAFKSSIEMEDIETMTTLLNCFKVDPNELLPAPILPYMVETCNPNAQPGTCLPLELAIRKKNRAMVHVLIKHGANVDALGTSKETMFDFAVNLSNSEILQDVISAFPTNDRFRFLGAACQGSYNDVKDMLGQGIDPDTSDSFGNTALVMAIKSRNPLIASLLLDFGADPETCSSAGLDPLQLAAFHEDFDTTQTLLRLAVSVEPPKSNNLPTALQFAVHRRDARITSILLDYGANVHAGRRDCRFPGWMNSWRGPESRPIFQAIYSGDSRICKILVERGAALNEGALSYAVFQEASTIIPLLLDAGVPFSEAALQIAARMCDLNVLRRSLEAGVDANSIKWGFLYMDKTPLTTAILGSYSWSPFSEQFEDVHDEGPRSEAVKLLLEAGADINDPRATLSALGAAIVKGYSQIVEFLISMGAHCDVPSVLASAVHRRNTSLLEKFLDAISMNRDLRGPSCLCLEGFYTAIVDQNEEAIEIFLRRAINLSSPCAVRLLNSACHYRAGSSSFGESSTSLAKTLIAAGAPVNLPLKPCSDCSWTNYARYEDSTPLQNAASCGNIEMVQLLLDHGANLGYHLDPDSQISNSALESAVVEGHAKIVDMLLDAGADANQRTSNNEDGWTVLQDAAGNGNYEIVDRLLRAGANVNFPPAPDGGVTALQAAAIRGFLGIAVKLLEAGADVNAPGAEEDGRTALEGAAEWGRIDMVQLLLSAGADIQSPEFGVGQYERAVKMARAEGHNALARLLEKHRASS